MLNRLEHHLVPTSAVLAKTIFDQNQGWNKSKKKSKLHRTASLVALYINPLTLKLSPATTK